MRLKRPHRRTDNFNNDPDGGTPSRSGMHADDYDYQRDADGGDGGAEYGESDARGLPEHEMSAYGASREDLADDDGKMDTLGGGRRSADGARRGYEGDFGDEEGEGEGEGEGDGDETMQD